MCATPTLVSMEPPAWRAQTLTNAYACPATEGNAARSVRDQLQLINTNSKKKRTNAERRRDAEHYWPAASLSETLLV